MEKKVIDINCFSIYFVKNHPGFDHVKTAIDECLRGDFKLIVPEILPFRAFWVLTTKWGIPKDIAKTVIHEFVRNYSVPVYVGLTREGILQSLEYATMLKHDIYDCYYLALAKQEEAIAILTTDTDFQDLCEKVGLTYENPVPLDVLKEFSA
jgi:predicted nucleic acid-binding protein